jgi:hypothetical protein
VAVDITVHVRTSAYPAGTPIPSVYVALHNSSTGAFITSTPTDGVGNAVFSAVSAGTYEVRFNLNQPGLVVNGNVQTITVQDPVVTTNIFDIEADISGMATASDARLCRLSGYWVDLSGSPLSGVKFTFHEFGDSTPHATYYSGSDTVKGVIPKSVSVITDAAGYAVIDLIRGRKYAAEVEGYNNFTFTQVEIPDLASAELVSVLFPLVERVEYEYLSAPVLPITDPEITLNVGDVVEVDFTVFLRSGIEVSYTLVTLTSSDAAKLSVSCVNNTLTLSAIATGTVSVDVVRKTSDGGSGTDIFPLPAIISNLRVQIV